MFGLSTQGIKPNTKLFLVDVRSSADFMQLSFAIGKGSKILMIFFLGKQSLSNRLCGSRLACARA